MGVRFASGLLALLLSLGAGRASAQTAPDSVAVAARDLARGVALQPADLAWRPAPADERSAPVRPGWVTRRVIRQGEPLDRPAVEPPPLVRSGDRVRVESGNGAVRLQLTGTAAATAAEGEEVWVRIDRGWRLRAVAVAPGVVRVGYTAREGEEL